MFCSKCNGTIITYGTENEKYNKCDKCGEISYPLKQKEYGE
jgi:DNA-directed RNA polymerase subunit M/transcription elongation factor TFIIS